MRRPKKGFRMTTDHVLVIAERHSRNSSRLTIRVRDPRRPKTLSLTLSRFKPAKGSF